MTVLTADPFRVAYPKFTFGAHDMLFAQEYGRFIAHENEDLGSAGQLKAVRLEVAA
jgi:hypothetical protein